MKAARYATSAVAYSVFTAGNFINGEGYSANTVNCYKDVEAEYLLKAFKHYVAREKSHTWPGIIYLFLPAAQQHLCARLAVIMIAGEKRTDNRCAGGVA